MDFSNKDNNQQLGDFIREQRLKKDLNLNDVSEKIGVPIQHLKNIENGDFSRFDEFYLKMYIKKYASFLSLNTDELYQRFYGEQIKQETVVKIQKQQKQKRNINIGKLGMIIAPVLVIGLVGYFIWGMIQQAGEPTDSGFEIQNPNSSEILGDVTKDPVEETKKPASKEPVVTTAQTLVSKVSQEDQTSVFDVETEKEEINLKIVFGESCWLDGTLNQATSIINGTYEKDAIFEQTLTKEQLQNNEGSLVFNIGNATGMVMTFNDEVIEIDPSLAPHQYITINMKVK